MDAATKSKLILAVLLGAAWGAVSYFPPGDAAQAADIIASIKLALGGLGVYHMRQSPKGGGDA